MNAVNRPLSTDNLTHESYFSAVNVMMLMFCINMHGASSVFWFILKQEV